MTVIKGAIFDMDGLLFDTEIVFDKAWRMTADNHNFNLDYNMQTELRGTSGKVMMKIIQNYVPQEDPAILMKELFDNAYIILQEEVPEKRGVHEILDYFRAKKIKMAVASSSPQYMIENNLKVSGIFQYFDVIVNGKEVKRGKPDPDIFILAANRLGCKTIECFVFEDARSGVAAGYSAGCKTIMIPDLVKPTEEEKRVAYGIYPTLNEALKDIKKLLD